MEELHRDEEQALFGLAEVDQADRVRMIEPRAARASLWKRLHPRRIGRHVRAEHLDGDDAIDRELLGLVDDAGAAFADALQDLEAVGEDLADERIGPSSSFPHLPILLSVIATRVFLPIDCSEALPTHLLAPMHLDHA